MTEEEAKTKPCIGPQPWNTGVPHVQADGRITYLCSGSACMAWRWLPREERLHAGGGWSADRMGIESTPGTLGADLPDDVVHTQWSQTIPNNLPREGYCGLAGRP